jgi:hypothetical protein
MSPSRRHAVGDLLQRELLESRATYRVVELEDEHAVVEAVDVPGLAAGHRLRLTLASLEAMTPVAAPADGAAEPQARTAHGAFPRPA